jgi:ATP-dependent Clp protease ATP-binding subunit ClpA
MLHQIVGETSLSGLIGGSCVFHECGFRSLMRSATRTLFLPRLGVGRTRLTRFVAAKLFPEKSGICRGIVRGRRTRRSDWGTESVIPTDLQ